MKTSLEPPFDAMDPREIFEFMQSLADVYTWQKAPFAFHTLINKISSDINRYDNQDVLSEINAIIMNHDFTEQEQKEQIESLLSKYPFVDLNTLKEEENSPLNTACREGKLSLVKLLLANNADINLTRDHYYSDNITPLASPLSLSIEFNHQDLTHLLLEQRANPNLGLAQATRFNPEMLFTLVNNYGAKKLITHPQERDLLGIFLTHYEKLISSDEKYLSIAAFIIDHKLSEVDALWNKGHSYMPLILKMWPELFIHAVQTGAFDKTPAQLDYYLKLAIEIGNKEAIHCLVKRGVDISLGIQWMMERPLGYNKELAAFLLEEGAKDLPMPPPISPLKRASPAPLNSQLLARDIIPAWPDYLSLKNKCIETYTMLKQTSMGSTQDNSLTQYWNTSDDWPFYKKAAKQLGHEYLSASSDKNIFVLYALLGDCRRIIAEQLHQDFKFAPLGDDNNAPYTLYYHLEAGHLVFNFSEKNKNIFKIPLSDLNFIPNSADIPPEDLYPYKDEILSIMEENWPSFERHFGMARHNVEDMKTSLHATKGPYKDFFPHLAARFKAITDEKQKIIYIEGQPVAKIQEELHTHSLFGSTSKSFTLFHCSEEYYPFLAEKIEEAFTAYLKHEDQENVVDAIARLVYYFSLAMPLIRGSASVIEMMTQVLFEEKGLDYEYQHVQGIIMDLVAYFSEDVEGFVKEFSVSLNRPLHTELMGISKLGT